MNKKIKALSKLTKITNYTKNGKCSYCGNCCTDLLPTTRKEIETIKKYIHKNKVKIVKKNFLALGTHDMTCIFLKDKKCLIYEVRPQICRSFICNKVGFKNLKNMDKELMGANRDLISTRQTFGGKKQ